MPHSYHNLLYHILFSTDKRRAWIDPELQMRLYPYMCGILRNLGGVCLEIGGVEDHVHLLARLRPDKSVSDVLRTLKANSSGWVHDTYDGYADFAWQEGYTAFTVSESVNDKVRAYIAGQTEHHRTHSFQEELIAFLKANCIEFEERFLR